MGWDEDRWGEVRKGEKNSHDMRWSAESEVQVWSVKWGVWSMHCDAWKTCLLDLALGGDVRRWCSWTATLQHLRRDTAHASSLDEKGLMVWPYGSFCLARPVRVLLVRCCPLRGHQEEVGAWRSDVKWAHELCELHPCHRNLVGFKCQRKLCCLHYTLHSKLYALHLTVCKYFAHSTHYTPHSTLYTLHSTLRTLHFTVGTLHCTLHAPHSTLFTFTPYTSHFDLHFLHLMYAPHATQKHCLVCTPRAPHSTHYTWHSTSHTPHFAFSILHSLL